MTIIKRYRVRALSLALVAVAAVGACDAIDDLLEAENPAAIGEDELNDAALIEVLVASVIGEFTEEYDDHIWSTSMPTDEQVTGINWEDDARTNQRIILFDEDPADNVFEALSAARQMADSVSGRLRTLLENPGDDVRLATTLAYAGYSYILLGEVMCEATINLSDEIFTPVQLYEFAVAKLDEALTIALAAGSDGEDVANLARVGLARAHLNLGNDAEVMTHAAAVPADFVWWIEYSVDAGENVMFDRIDGNNHALGVHPRFLNGTFGDNLIVATQTDPRIQHTVDWSRGHNQLTPLYKPFQSLPYSGYNGETIADGGEPILYERDTDIKLASGLEARHHFAEADGPTAATLVFVNDRRAFGNQSTVALAGDALMAELREQRARDLYLGGFRMGDLRRYARQGVNDPAHAFPSGEHVNEQWGGYGDDTCFPIPIDEYDANPDLPRPGS
ncbi:MAG: RagB/SusD family nutrient uptake outer membrane protein [Longimicrobiales bacterium]